jgi:hypothetical protein
MVDITATSAALTRGVKFRKNADVALTKSPFTKPPMTAAASWAISTAYNVGDVVKNGNNAYICIQAGTSAGSGGPTATNGRTITDNTALWIYLGPSAAGPTDPGAPAYSSGTSAPGGLSNVYYPALSPSSFKLSGASAVNSGNSWDIRRFARKAATYALGDARVSFWTDAPKFSFLAAATSKFRVSIDGQFFAPGSVAYVASGTGFHTFDYTASGGRKPRLVEVWGNVSFYGVAVSSLDMVWAPSSALDDITAVWIGDSLFDGSSYGPMLESAPQIAGSLLGWANNWNFGTGGTGYMNPGASSYYTFGQRIAEALTRNPDIWAIAGSINDKVANGYTSAQVTAAALSSFQAIRAGGSTAPIAVIGSWSIDDATNGYTQIAATETAVMAAVDQFNDPLGQTFKVPICGDPILPWVTHGNNNLARSTSANIQQVTANDGIHPPDVGTTYWAQRLARAFREGVIPNIK